MKVTRIIKFEVTDVIETDDFYANADANDCSVEIIANKMKKLFNFDDVRIISSKAFVHDGTEPKFTCDTCIHFNSDRFEFPCEECERAYRNKPSMYIAKGEHDA